MTTRSNIPGKVVARVTFAACAIALFLGGKEAADMHVRHVSGGLSLPVNCVSCHPYLKRQGVLKSWLEENYLSPRNVSVSNDGSRLAVVAEDSEELIVVALADRRVERRVPLGRRPHSVALGRLGRTAYVSNTWSDNVSVVDLEEHAVVAEISVGSAPTGLAVHPSKPLLFVANSSSDDISVIDLDDRTEVRRLPAGNQPYAVAVSPDGRNAYVTNRLTNPVHFREPPSTEVTVIDVPTLRVGRRVTFGGAHLLEGIDVDSNDQSALVTLVRPKQLIPSTQVDRGWMLTYGLGIISPGIDEAPLQLLLDEVNAFFSDPYDVVIDPILHRAYVSHAGADIVTVVSLDSLSQVVSEIRHGDVPNAANHLGLSSRYVVARIPTGSNPKGLAISPDGDRLYVAERLEDRIAVIDTRALGTVDYVDLGGPTEVSVLRLGARTFHGARAFQGQFSCRSCHPANDQDALAWDFAEPMGLGRNIVNTMTLRDIGATGPFKWAGTNVSLYMQDGIRFAKHLTRVDPFPPRELKALVAYIYAIPQPPNRYVPPGAGLTDAQERGRQIFQRTQTVGGTEISPSGRCITCHPPPYFTNRLKADVGTLRSTDKEMDFDTPQLINIYDSAPYLHDGSAQTLEEIWTLNSVNDEHGVVSDLSKTQLNDLVEYLRTLGSDASDNL